MILLPTPGQTVGPFFHYALPYQGGNDLVALDHPGRIRLHGTVFDAQGAPVPDALIEIRQAGPDGVVPTASGSLARDGFTFTGWGRAATDRCGHYSFTTVRPAPTKAGHPAFFSVCVFARGLLDRLFTRAYLPENLRALANDRLLSSVDPDRRSTLIADADTDGYQFNIHLQGETETVFLEHSLS